MSTQLSKGNCLSNGWKDDKQSIIFTLGFLHSSTTNINQNFHILMTYDKNNAELYKKKCLKIIMILAIFQTARKNFLAVIWWLTRQWKWIIHAQIHMAKKPHTIVHSLFHTMQGNKCPIHGLSNICIYLVILMNEISVSSSSKTCWEYSIEAFTNSHISNGHISYYFFFWEISKIYITK